MTTTAIQVSEIKTITDGRATYLAPLACPVCGESFGKCEGMQRYGFRFALNEDGTAQEPFRYASAAKCATCGLCNDGYQCSDCYHREEYDAGLDGDHEDFRDTEE